MAECYVEIYRFNDGFVERRMGPVSERDAERVQRVVMININHAKWGCRIVASPPRADGKEAE